MCVFNYLSNNNQALVLYNVALLMGMESMIYYGSIVDQIKIIEIKIYYSQVVAAIVYTVLILIVAKATPIFALEMILFLLCISNLYMYFINKKHVIHLYKVHIVNFSSIDFISRQSKYTHIKTENSTSVFEILTWPYNGLRFYLQKRDKNSTNLENQFELIAPKIVAENFCNDLSSYHGTKIQILSSAPLKMPDIEIDKE